MIRQILDWLEQRTGAPSAIRRFLDEDIPSSSGWRQVFGSVALFLFLTQAFSGILLALNFAPVPGEAYNSLQYIVREVTGGRIIRGLHHWGASMMIVVVVLHMVQVFLWGAYKKPREATWIAGAFLLLMTLAYGLTGYLLPWDNRAYWGTVVTTRIAGGAPVAGAWILELMGATSGIGAVTFARFYTVHVLLLPPLTLLLIAVHVYLVRRHGVAPAPDDNLPRKKFYPGQVFKDTTAIFAAFAVLFLMAVFATAPLGRLADPTDTSYVPRPEWYFLFLFQMLKYFEGPLEVVGSIVLPTCAMLALILTPFIDRGAAKGLRRRVVAFSVVVFGAIGWTGLTAAAVADSPKSEEVLAEFEGLQDWQQLSPEELAGFGYIKRENCVSCHALGGGEQRIGPDLARAGIRKNAAWLIAHFKNPQGKMPGSQMPAIQLSDSQLNALAAFLLKLNPKNAAALTSAPLPVLEGALIYQAHRCGSCHQINGVGVKMAPPLNGLAMRRSREWVEEHFLTPQKLSPGTVMPAYRFSRKELERITTYLMLLP
jgi:ubiquinol-cytochrome c reductase cytochrome b subunit